MRRSGEKLSNLVIVNPLEADVCPACGGSDIAKNGRRINQNDITQRFMCKTCGISFSERGYYGFKAKHSLFIRHSAIELYQDGLSLRRVVKRLKDTFDLSVSHVSVGRWITDAGISLRDKQHKTTIKAYREVVTVSVLVKLCSSEFPEKTIYMTEQMRIRSKTHGKLFV